MQAAFPKLRAVCIVDGDNQDKPDERMQRTNLSILRWRRYEIENYLLQPSAIKRFLSAPPLLASEIDQEFWKQVPPGTNLFGDHVSLVRVKASTEFLDPLLKKVGLSTPKRDLYLLAAAMNPDEIHPEIVEKLDQIADSLNPARV